MQVLRPPPVPKLMSQTWIVQSGAIGDLTYSFGLSRRARGSPSIMYLLASLVLATRLKSCFPYSQSQYKRTENQPKQALGFMGMLKTLQKVTEAAASALLSCLGICPRNSPSKSLTLTTSKAAPARDPLILLQRASQNLNR